MVAVVDQVIAQDAVGASARSSAGPSIKMQPCRAATRR